MIGSKWVKAVKSIAANPVWTECNWIAFWALGCWLLGHIPGDGDASPGDRCVACNFPLASQHLRRNP